MPTLSNINLYTEDGWLDIEAIRSLGCWAHVIIGPRQVGKTYGTLKSILEHDTKFFYLRRTAEELELILSDDSLNPFLPLEHEGYNINMFKSGKVYRICDYTLNNSGLTVPGTFRGIASHLMQVSKIRGFSGEIYEDLIYDEFIPERIVVKRQAEGDGLLNAYITINGNRELAGKKPLRLWLLANANDVNSPVLSALELVSDVEKLMRRGKEWTVKNGIFICMPQSQKVIEKRKETALMKHLSDKSALKRMALNNEFSYNNLTLIAPKDLSGFLPSMSVDDIYFYITKNHDHLYCSNVPHPRHPKYRSANEKERFNMMMQYPDIRIFYDCGKLTFDNIQTWQKFRKIWEIKEKVV